jgi:hypothetical protein
MTSQQKKYMELGDILTLRLDCRACECSLTIPISRDLSAREEAFKLNDCPICRAPWATLNGSMYQPLIAEFTDKLKRLKNALETAPLGFRLSIEISDPDQEDASK